MSAAIACEQQSVAATQAMLQFPANAAIPGAPPSNETAVIINGVANAGVAGNFGVPAAFFYALAATMPVQITAAQRFTRATGDQLSRLLTDLTTAISAGTISDSESCVTTQSVVTVNAAQAARRIAALGVPAGSATPLAPLGTVALATVKDAPKGTSLTFASTTGIADGMLVSGPGIAPGATVQSSTADWRDAQAAGPQRRTRGQRDRVHACVHDGHEAAGGQLAGISAKAAGHAKQPGLSAGR